MIVRRRYRKKTRASAAGWTVRRRSRSRRPVVRTAVARLVRNGLVQQRRPLLEM
ncbi:hypothetical protein HSR121_3098 [Halapricum desulfuricans]|uniref:Uncharacterized protein n=1 Tax=Halapricum desulfuricans TaxID=2841257 RepID=A0A897N3V7_9EURY|nr:hypothetical protein HSR121_3098 [Halapricum desulfuricans]